MNPANFQQTPNANDCCDFESVSYFVISRISMVA